MKMEKGSGKGRKLTLKPIRKSPAGHSATAEDAERASSTHQNLATQHMLLNTLV